MSRCFLCQSKIASFLVACDAPWMFWLCGGVCVRTCSVTSDSEAPWTVAHQGPPSIEFSGQEFWNELPFPPPGDLPDPGIKPISLASPALQADSLPLVPPGKLLCGQQLKLNMKITRVIYIFREIIYHLSYFWLCWAFISAQAFL